MQGGNTMWLGCGRKAYPVRNNQKSFNFLTLNNKAYVFPCTHAPRVRIFVIVWRLQCFDFDFWIKTALESSFTIIWIASIFGVGIFGAVASQYWPLLAAPHGALLLLVVALLMGLSFASECVLRHAVCPLVWRLSFWVFRWDLWKLTSYL